MLFLHWILNCKGKEYNGYSRKVRKTYIDYLLDAIVSIITTRAPKCFTVMNEKIFALGICIVVY